MKRDRFEKVNIQNLRERIRTSLNNKYFNLWMGSYVFEGVSEEANDFIMRKLWFEGSVACFAEKFTKDLIFAPFAAQTYNIYDFPEKVQLINIRAVTFIPTTPQLVNKDVVLLYAQPNHKAIRMIVDDYIDRIVNVEMVINTNLSTHKIPFLYAVNPQDEAKAKDVVTRILNDEPVIFMDFNELQNVQALITNTPYIIDKLYQYKISLENELLTYLGIDNAPDEKKERLIVDEVNANNALINANRSVVLTQLEDFCDKVNEILVTEGIEEISVICKYESSASVHEENYTTEEGESENE